MIPETINVVPYEYQVGGHSKTDGLPASLKDEQGRFLKKLQVGERGDREVAFYKEIEEHRQAAAGTAGVGGDSEACSFQQQLAKWVPKSYGVRHVSGADYLVLDDVAAAYKLPCVLDVKIGYQTWYPWASDSLKQKYRQKDASTTQASLGFRVCGVLVHNSSSGDCWRVDRHWGKQLTADNVQEAFHRFAGNGHINLADILSGPGMLLEQLHALADLFTRQRAWHFFSTSLLVVYEGAARSPAELQLAVKLIDFAHTFPVVTPSSGGACQTKEEGAAGPAGVDQNFLSGLCSLRDTLQQMLLAGTQGVVNQDAN